MGSCDCGLAAAVEPWAIKPAGVVPSSHAHRLLQSPALHAGCSHPHTSVRHTRSLHVSHAPRPPGCAGTRACWRKRRRCCQGQWLCSSMRVAWGTRLRCARVLGVGCLRASDGATALQVSCSMGQNHTCIERLRDLTTAPCAGRVHARVLPVLPARQVLAQPAAAAAAGAAAAAHAAPCARGHHATRRRAGGCVWVGACCVSGEVLVRLPSAASQPAISCVVGVSVCGTV